MDIHCWNHLPFFDIDELKDFDMILCEQELKFLKLKYVYSTTVFNIKRKLWRQRMNKKLLRHRQTRETQKSNGFRFSEDKHTINNWYVSNTRC